MIQFLQVVKYKRLSTGQKIYRAEVDYNGRKVVLSRHFTRAREAEAYGRKVQDRIMTLSKQTQTENPQ